MGADVAIVNTAEETIELLDLLFQEADLTTARAYTVDFKRGRQYVSDFLTFHDPRVVVWDIAFPYAENWRYLQEVQQLPAARGRRFVMTTTNERALRELTGEAGIQEIAGKPFDLDQLTRQVRAALAAP